MKKQDYITPSAKDIEEVVLGALLIDRKAIDEVMLIVKNDEVFYEPKHRYIFKAMRLLYEKNEAVDMLTVSDQLKSMDKFDVAGGDFYLIELSKKVASSAHIEQHCRILHQKWMRREFIKAGSDLMAKAYDGREDVFDILNSVSVAMDFITEQISGQRGETTIAQILDDIRDRIERLTNKKENEISGIPTGFKKVDRFTGGWQPSDLIVIAGRPGMGKTALVLSTLLACLKEDIPCGMISLEMSKNQLVTRLIAANSHFHLNQLFKHGFDKQEYFIKFLEVKDEMQKFPIYFDEESTDIRHIYARARLWKRKYDIKLLVVDYIQLASDKTKSHREQEISSISRNLKRLAKELHIPVIAISQLNREVENRSNKRPKLSDIRESGAIEQDADIITFIYRPEYYKLPLDKEFEDMGANAEFNFAKYRNGSLDRIGLYFDANKTKFMDPETGNKEAAIADDDEVPF